MVMVSPDVLLRYILFIGVCNGIYIGGSGAITSCHNVNTSFKLARMCIVKLSDPEGK